MVVLAFGATISTNTKTFHDYSYSEMFKCATNMAAEWRLELPSPLGTDMITDFHSSATPAGISGNLTFNNRFLFSWLYGGNPHLNDQMYSCLRTETPNVEANDDVLERWARATNLLTLQQAQQIAIEGMMEIGLPLEAVDFRQPARAHQFKYQSKDGKVYPLPYYQFHWQTKLAACTVDVSGIIGRIVYFDYTDFRAAYLRLHKPANYFDMLGLPENPIFVRQMSAAPGESKRYVIIGSLK